MPLSRYACLSKHTNHNSINSKLPQSFVLLLNSYYQTLQMTLIETSRVFLAIARQEMNEAIFLF